MSTSQQGFVDFYLPQLLYNTESILQVVLSNPGQFAQHMNDRSSDLYRLFSLPDGAGCCRYKPLEGQCLGCQVGKALTVGKFGTPYLMNCPNGDQNLPVVFKFSQKRPIHCAVMKESAHRAQYQQQRACFSGDYGDVLLLGCDEFLNETLIGFLLVGISKGLASVPENDVQTLYPYGAPTAVKHYGALICPESTVNVMEFVDGGDLTDFFKNFPRYANPFDRRVLATYEILTQVSGTLLHLQTYFEFTHGDLKCANLFASRKPSVQRMHGRTLTFDFTVKVADYGKSALTVPLQQPLSSPDGSVYKRVRVYNHHPIMSLATDGEAPVRRDKERGEWYYQLPQLLTVVSVYAKWRHMGLPYHKSFDTYIFMISMMLQEDFFEIFHRDQYLFDTWRMLWFPEDLAQIEKRLESAHVKYAKKEREGTTICIKMLEGLKLKCSATQILWSRMIESNLYVRTNKVLQ